MRRITYEQDVYDGLPAEARYLAREYGLNIAFNVLEAVAWDYAIAREVLEDNRRALQVARWENIR